MIRRYLALALAFGFLTLSGQAFAHTPIFSCLDNGDGTIFCEGGFSDGSTAAGTPIIVKDGAGKEIFRGELSPNSDIVFDKPEGEFSVLFDRGPGYRIEIPGAQIFE